MMARKGGRPAFTDDQVRLIKANLVNGVTCAALARHYGVGEETIGRIRRGLTYSHIKVAGEEQLRPEIRVVERAPGTLDVLAEVRDEDVEASIAEFNARMAQTKVVNAAVSEADAIGICHAMRMHGANPPAKLKAQYDALPGHLREPLE